MIRALLIFVLLGTPLRADNVNVVTDIPPIHGLAAMVMGDTGTPGLIIEPGSDPHHMALRPSNARQLQQADIIIWMGPELTPWLEDAVEGMGSNATHLELLHLDGTLLLDAAEDEDGAHDHSHGHAHEGVDPHAWLSPKNAIHWLDAIAGQLSTLDPANAGVYANNAELAATRIADQAQIADGTISQAALGAIIAEHDGLGYFADAFDITIAGTVTDTDDTPPSPAHLRELQDLVAAQDVSCALLQPGSTGRLIDAVFEGRPYKHSTVSALGTGLDMGVDYYPTLLSDLTQAVAGCSD